MPSLEDRFDLLVELRAWRPALETAQKLRDPYRLNEVGRLCNDESIGRLVHAAIAKL